MPISVAIGVEDDLSECIWRRVINHKRRDMTVRVRFPLKTLPGGRDNDRNIKEKRGLSGYGQLKVNLPAFNNAASKGLVYAVLTDLDVHVRCPGQLLPKWLRGIPASPNLMCRVAVKEVESWLLADTANFAAYLHVPTASVPGAVETLLDPKVEIVRLARLSTSPEIRQDMIPEVGSTAEVGPNFERMLINFTRNLWSIDEAAKNSRSLRRALDALERFRPTVIT